MTKNVSGMFGIPEKIAEHIARLQLTGETLVAMFKNMCVIRHFECMADQLYSLGKVHGTMHLSAGQEAVAVGYGFAMCPDDYLLNHHRGHGHFSVKGADIHLMMAEFLGKGIGLCRGRGGSMRIADFASHNLGANGIMGGSNRIGLRSEKSRNACSCWCIYRWDEH